MQRSGFMINGTECDISTSLPKMKKKSVRSGGIMQVQCPNVKLWWQKKKHKNTYMYICITLIEIML